MAFFHDQYFQLGAHFLQPERVVEVKSSPVLGFLDVVEFEVDPAPVLCQPGHDLVGVAGAPAGQFQ